MTRPQPTPLLYLRATLFWAGFSGSTIVFACTFPFLILLDWHGRFRVLSQWTRFNVWWLKVTCGLGFEVTGTEHLAGEAKVLLCKHQSTWETLGLQRVIPPQVWVLKRELMRIPLFGWGMSLVHPIAVDRSAGRKAISQLVRQGQDRLQRGLWVVIFPEGTRTAPGERGRYKLGGAVLAARSGRPVIPVAHNAGLYWPKGSFIKYPGTIRMQIGPPIPTEGRRAEDIMADAEEWIESHTNALCGIHSNTETQPGSEGHHNAP
ncbi:MULTISPECIES: lysophospholipid acyltransferase family protein [Ectothiorhodospira]|uniref:lysophospholipid acyltransferase family protein n=1 Tax=Ectothiorhodospira TaxID=1051 RepID=UPI001EE7A720|nr:1-acyl-sn-glycerol-3-phosphate acyltransferase [Ectothiorhodospira variabilis]MCG5496468.1 1-acyl-sn-glycerol-3-phosphate acyltransferase [Ectothiorhodospira variabilis]MCG5504070.1 1-acyl-sn-glycerol-3-phosphate acyltransferase [Ectothiorhodospira variabilis]MCG5507225.1 1-acyl-sn-glycerol-3-phosphate acyltransferase [Ectothiorhodospira variabilis]MCG5524994.1 1-acyl-sn-glycerol-3-phosphate acyltransferase [Ectothiorhodospira haloalkaliphila]